MNPSDQCHGPAAPGDRETSSAPKRSRSGALFCWRRPCRSVILRSTDGAPGAGSVAGGPPRPALPCSQEDPVPSRTALILVVALAAPASSAEFPTFRTQEIDARVGDVCYAVTTADVDGDG